MKSPSTSCNLDPIPTWLLKKCLNELLPIITQIINMSIVDADVLKCAQITPLLKKPNLDCKILKNYRPVANLKFLAKTIERVCASQINDYLSSNNLCSKMQSAFKSCHSTETALLRVYNDLLLVVDQGNEAVLILLDYSAAFDAISHNVFLDRLFHRYGVSGSALNWFKTYLTNRTQSVVINNSLSEPHVPIEGVFVRDLSLARLFALYTAPLEDIIKAHGFGRMIYAEDTQVYVILKNDSDCTCIITKLERCRGERGELAPHVFLLTWLLPTYGDDVFMLHIKIIPIRIPGTYDG